MNIPLSKSKRKGSAFHKTVELLEKSILKDGNAKIKSPESIVDIVTGRKREHDIVIYFEDKHHTIKISLECRDYKVGSSQVEAFKTKCEHTKIDKGIFVSSDGFTKPALKKAIYLGIDCLTLKQVENLKWLIATNMVVEKSIGKKIYVTVIPSKPLNKDIKQYKIVDSNSKMVDNNIFMNKALESLNKSNSNLKNGEQVIKMPFKAVGFYLQDNQDSSIFIPIKSFICYLTVEKIIEKIPFINYQYKDEDNKKIVSDLAIAQTDFMDKKMTFTLVSGSNGIDLSVHTEDK